MARISEQVTSTDKILFIYVYIFKNLYDIRYQVDTLVILYQNRYSHFSVPSCLNMCGYWGRKYYYKYNTILPPFR